MAKKLGIIVLLCFSLCVGGVSAFADEGHAEADTGTLPGTLRNRGFCSMAKS